MVLWLRTLRVKYKELTAQVREQLEALTKEAAQGSRKTDLDMYLSVMDSELEKATDVLTQHDFWSVDPTAVALKTKVHDLPEARAALLAIQTG